MNLDQMVFLAIAKAVRKEQEYRKNNEHLLPNQSTSAFITVEMYTAEKFASYDFNKDKSEDEKKAFPTKQFYAICYKLQEMGFVKIKKGYVGARKGSTTKISLDVEGVKYIKSLKKKRAAK